MTTFKAQVDEIILRNKKVVDAVIRESVQRTIEKAQLSRQKGGNMPVFTGFLRASGRLSLNGFPSGPDRPGEAGKTYSESEGAFTATLAQAQAGNTLYFAWSAVYARRMNYKYGFLDLAAQAWPQTVAEVVKELKR